MYWSFPAGARLPTAKRSSADRLPWCKSGRYPHPSADSCSPGRDWDRPDWRYAADRVIGVRLDARQVGLKRDPAVVSAFALRIPEERARELHRSRVVRAIERYVCERARPHELVRYAVKVEIRTSASPDGHKPLTLVEGRIEAKNIVFGARG